VLGIHLIGRQGEGGFEFASKMGVKVFQTFLHSPKQLRIVRVNVERWNSEAEKFPDIIPVVHASYLINPFTDTMAKYQDGFNILLNTMRTASTLDGVDTVVVHPGALVNLRGSKTSRYEQAATLFDSVLNDPDVYGVRIALETMPGAGSQVAGFAQMHRLYNLIENNDKVGICWDTAHMVGYGYDLRSESGFDMAVSDFLDYFSIDDLLVLHLNDTPVRVGSKKDVHTGVQVNSPPSPMLLRALQQFKGIPQIVELSDYDTSYRTINTLKNYI